MEKFDLKKVLKSLSKKRPVFHSEADFQFALAWEIKEEYKSAEIRLEKRFETGKKNNYFDIFFELDGKKYAIELKYKTAKLEDKLYDEEYNLKGQSAQDCGRYDFLKDVQRLEKLKESKKINQGFAIFLTNDHYYWSAGRKENSVDAKFRINEDRKIEKDSTLEWTSDAADGTKKGRTDPIKLKKDYTCKWFKYSALFQYLLFEI
ncbi:MAG TPA: hypothetical protein PLW78_10240 [bacterium]|nr:hypothetical protein [bacterium]HRQ70665.1 hypothetical protein [bacterium]